MCRLVLSSRCILNMKRLVTLKHKQRKTSKASQESDLEACQRFWNNSDRHEYLNTKKFASPNGLNSRKVRLEQSNN